MVRDPLTIVGLVLWPLAISAVSGGAYLYFTHQPSQTLTKSNDTATQSIPPSKSGLATSTSTTTASNTETGRTSERPKKPIATQNTDEPSSGTINTSSMRTSNQPSSNTPVRDSNATDYEMYSDIFSALKWVKNPGYAGMHVLINLERQRIYCEAELSQAINYLNRITNGRGANEYLVRSYGVQNRHFEACLNIYYQYRNM